MRPVIETLVGQPRVWVLTMALLFGTVLGTTLSRGAALRPPPALGAFPSFSSRDDRGAPFTEADLRGRAFIANRLSPGGAETMRTLQRRTRNLGDALVLVSFSGTQPPARSDPRSARRWLLIAGPPPAGLPGDGGELVLVDARLRIRGRYLREQLDDLLRDASLVVNGD